MLVSTISILMLISGIGALIWRRELEQSLVERRVNRSFRRLAREGLPSVAPRRRFTRHDIVPTCEQARKDSSPAWA